MVWIIGDKVVDVYDKDIEYVYDEKTWKIYDILYSGVSLSNGEKKKE